MSRPLQLTSWKQELATRFAALPDAVVAVLALYSFGMILGRACGLTTVCLFLVKHLGLAYFAVRKRLREFYLDAPAKSGVKHGVKRQDFDVSSCFAPLLRWVLSLWSGKRLPLAIDVTNLADRFHVLCVSVVVCGVAIPVAWKVLYGGVKDPWGPYWEKLLSGLKDAVPAGWTVLVLSDRGLESPRLFRFIVGLGWHPLMRVKKGGKFRPNGWGNFYHFHQLVRQVGGSFYAEGTAYAGEQLRCTLLACWSAGHDEPWLLLSDLPAEAGNAVWYGLRTWIEQGFKIIKSGVWDWQKTRMDDPGRVERLWLVLAVATLWVVAVGAEDEVQQGVKEELRKLEREMSESTEQARTRLESERLRREKHEQALKERQARQQQREALKQEQREKERREKQARKRASKGQAADQTDARPAVVQPKKSRPRTAIKKQEGAKVRTHRVSSRGLAELHALWQKGQNRLPQHLHPEPWPKPCHSVSTLTEAEFLSQQT
jgi:hypothetical protein